MPLAERLTLRAMQQIRQVRDPHAEDARVRLRQTRHGPLRPNQTKPSSGWR